MEVYLDNSATTRAYDEVGDLVRKVMCEDYGNPSSMHAKGVQAEHYIKDTREILAKLLKVKDKEIIFTSGGTESDNLALIGAARANRRRGCHLITSSIEHPAVLNTMRYLEEEEGFRVTYLPVDRYGRIRLEALEEALCPETILVSVMYVNNEVGSVQPVDAAADLVKAYNREILFHVGRGAGLREIQDLSQAGEDRHAHPERPQDPRPQGDGRALHRGACKDQAHCLRGRAAEEHPLRDGECARHRGARAGCKDDLRRPGGEGGADAGPEARFIGGVQKLDDITIHGLYDETSAPHIISVGFAGIRSEVLLHALEERGICVSSGSACASNHPAISGVLKGIGADKEYLDATLRFSMSEFTTAEEIDYTLETLYNLEPVLRRYTRR